MVERFNQTVQNMLVKFIDKKKDTWEDYLDTCVFAYNTARHESSKFTPFELMFGRRGKNKHTVCTTKTKGGL